jgi:1,4-alpha-glucan branching enzyme
MSLLSDRDLYLFNEGSHVRLYDHVGCHLAEHEGRSGAWFSVWAPDAKTVSAIGTFNDWNLLSNPLISRGESGLWEVFVPGVKTGDTYKFHIVSKLRNYQVDKGLGSLLQLGRFRMDDDPWTA